METYYEQQMRFLRTHVKVAKQAKENGWPNLFEWSIKQAENIIKEFEKKFKVPDNRYSGEILGDTNTESGLEWLGI